MSYTDPTGNFSDGDRGDIDAIRSDREVDSPGDGSRESDNNDSDRSSTESSVRSSKTNAGDRGKQGIRFSRKGVQRTPSSPDAARVAAGKELWRIFRGLDPRIAEYDVRNTEGYIRSGQEYVRAGKELARQFKEMEQANREELLSPIVPASVWELLAPVKIYKWGAKLFRRGNKTVGRHMNPVELANMRRTGRVQEGGKGQTRVADPASPTSYKNALKGDVYVEFDVPANRVLPQSKGTGRILGPNSPDS